uniref:replicative DNA helicase n=1 Tax=Prosthecobacter sp. TaxID=1965333 RepID=UPI0037846B84
MSEYESSDEPAFDAHHPEGGEAFPGGKKRKGGEPSTEDMLAGINRQLPFSDEAEKGILSCLLQGGIERLSETRAMLPAEAFYHLPNRHIYEAILALDDARLPIEVVMLTNWLRDKGQLDKVGGSAAISELYTFVPIDAHAPYYRKVAFAKWILRDAIKVCAKGINGCYEHGKEDPAQDTGDTVAAIESDVFALLERIRTGQGDDGPVHSSAVVTEVIDHVEKLMHNKGKLLGASTGWVDLDRAIGGQGLEPGDVFVCGARPKMGKTNVLCSMVKSIAVDQDIPTLVLSLEMSRRRLWNRIMFGGFGIETSKASTGFLEKPKAADYVPGDDDGDLEDTGGMTRGDQENLTLSRMKMSRAKLWVHDKPMDTNDLRAVVRMMVRKHGIKCCAIDYVQLVRSVTKRGQGEERHQIAEAMDTIHSLAKEFGIFFIVLAQANRSAESNPGKEPSDKDYDGGSAIEKYLDYGSFIHRPARYKKWGQLDKEQQAAFRAMVEPRRKRNPELWSRDVPVRNGFGQ